MIEIEKIRDEALKKRLQGALNDSVERGTPRPFFRQFQMELFGPVPLVGSFLANLATELTMWQFTRDQRKKGKLTWPR